MYTTPPSHDDILALADAALAAMPAHLSARVRGTAMLVEDLADEETLAEMGIAHPHDLTGLYRGVPLTARGVSDVPMVPDSIHLYAQAILIEWVETGEDLGRLVASVLVHEIAHHFGYSDADIEAIEAEMA